MWLWSSFSRNGILLDVLLQYSLGKPSLNISLSKTKSEIDNQLPTLWKRNHLDNKYHDLVHQFHMKCLKFIFANDTKVKFLLFLVNIFLVQISPSEISARHTIIYNVILHKICIILLISCTISGPSTFLKPLVPEFGILPKLSLTF